MHHKRGRSKNQRAGCLSCKPHKMCGAKATFRDVMSVKRSIVSEREQVTGDAYDGYSLTLFEEAQADLDRDEAARSHPDGLGRSIATIGDVIASASSSRRGSELRTARGRRRAARPWRSSSPGA